MRFLLDENFPLFSERKPSEKLFDLMPNGEIVGWEFKDLARP